MNRRSFLSFLGIGFAAAAAPILELLPPTPPEFPLFPVPLLDTINETTLKYIIPRIKDEIYRPNPIFYSLSRREAVNHYVFVNAMIDSLDFRFLGKYMVIPGRKTLPPFEYLAYRELPTELCPYPGKVLNPLRPYAPRVEDVLIDPYHFVVEEDYERSSNSRGLDLRVPSERKVELAEVRWLATGYAGMEG